MPEYQVDGSFDESTSVGYEVGDFALIDGTLYEVLDVDKSNPPHVSVQMRPVVYPHIRK